MPYPFKYDPKVARGQSVREDIGAAMEDESERREDAKARQMLSQYGPEVQRFYEQQREQMRRDQPPPWNPNLRYRPVSPQALYITLKTFSLLPPVDRALGPADTLAQAVNGPLPPPGGADPMGQRTAMRRGAFPRERSYDPPDVQRPVEADYPRERWPNGPPTDHTGRILRDVDGREIKSQFVVGRRTAQGGDEAVSAAQLDAFTEATTGRSAEVGPPPASWNGKHRTVLGETQYHKQRLTPQRVLIRDDLDAAQFLRTQRHEFGHVVHFLARGISDKGVSNQLQRLYHGGRTGEWGRMGDRSRRGIEDPANHGYKSKPAKNTWRGERDQGIERNQELWAEAIRIYATSPGWMKENAPAVAARIRQAVNERAGLRGQIHFNAYGGPAAALGLGAYGYSQDPRAEEERRQQQSIQRGY